MYVRVLLLGYILLRSFILYGQQFCALTVNIERSDGVPARMTWVNLIDSARTIERRELIEGPTARISDFRFGPHSIVVPPNECYPITVSNLRLDLTRPIILNVRKSRREGEEDHTGCKVLLRVLDKQGQGIRGASAVTDGHPWQMGSDEFGRVQSLLGAGESPTTISADGYQPRSLALVAKKAET